MLDAPVSSAATVGTVTFQDPSSAPHEWCDSGARGGRTKARLATPFKIILESAAEMTPLRSVSLGFLFGDGEEGYDGAAQDKTHRHSAAMASLKFNSSTQTLSTAAERAHLKMSKGGRLDIDTAYELMGYGHDEVHTRTIGTGTRDSSQYQTAIIHMY